MTSRVVRICKAWVGSFPRDPGIPISGNRLKSPNLNGVCNEPVIDSAARLILGNSSKPRRQRQRQRQRCQAKGLSSNTVAVHVRYNSLYILLPFSGKQQRQMTKFCVLWRT